MNADELTSGPPRLARPPLLLRIYAFLTFPWSVEGSLVWWWRMHVNGHGEPHGRCACPYCPQEDEKVLRRGLGA